MKRLAHWLSHNWKWAVGMTVAAVAALAGVAAAVVALVGVEQAGEAADPSQRRPALEKVDLDVRHSRGKPGIVVDVKLRNAGDAGTVIKQANLRVVDVARIPHCYSPQTGGGDGYLDVSYSYSTVLPPNAGVGHTLRVGTSQDVGAGDANRFTILIAHPRARPVNPSKSGIRIFRLLLTLVSGAAGARTELGAVLVPFPWAPSSPEYYWSQELKSSPEDLYRAFRDRFPFEALPCWSKNVGRLRGILSKDGERPVTLRRVAAEIVAPVAIR